MIIGYLQLTLVVMMVSIVWAWLVTVRSSDSAGFRRALVDTERDVVVDLPGGKQGLVRAVPVSMLGGGSAAFMEQYGVKYPMYTGAMAKGIASADLVIAAGKKGMLGSFGAGGLPLHLVTAGLDKIQAALPNGPYAVNLIHAPADEGLESGGVELFLKRGVRIVEASAFMKLTPWIVRYRVAGLERDASGRTVCRNKVIFKVSRTELATLAMHPPPADMVAKLLAKGLVTAEQAALAPGVTMCDDVAVESDSGGHTDNRHMPVLLPVILAQRDRIAKETGMRIRVGAGGGVGCPEAAAAAFAMGADFIVTGTINQMCRQSGSCDIVRKQLSEATYSDITMAPAADMFEMGVDLQVLKKGTMFPARAKKLYEIFVQYPSLDAQALAREVGIAGSTQPLDSHQLVEVVIGPATQVHHAHAPGAQFPDHLERPDGARQPGVLLHRRADRAEHRVGVLVVGGKHRRQPSAQFGVALGQFAHQRIPLLGIACQRPLEPALQLLKVALLHQ